MLGHAHDARHTLQSDSAWGFITFYFRWGVNKSIPVGRCTRANFELFGNSKRNRKIRFRGTIFSLFCWGKILHHFALECCAITFSELNAPKLIFAESLSLAHNSNCKLSSFRVYAILTLQLVEKYTLSITADYFIKTKLVKGDSVLRNCRFILALSIPIIQHDCFLC
jgi:hypothetical protein